MIVKRSNIGVTETDLLHYVGLKVLTVVVMPSGV